MSDIAIRVDGLSKQYQLGAREGYRTFRDAFTDTLAAPFRRIRSNAAQKGAEKFWALEDVSFEVRSGEVVGIIGKNGAGKSTLLKILSRITHPTKGYAEIHGSVRSLLEVGTGFHPELTGRENIFLNGAILGMKKIDIQRNFDEIVAFAGTEQFLDTPVKHYSSGMHVRLAFGVAAHLESEILLVDEVLAVGDAEFQRKCLSKMQQVALGGRTIIFVSHNMAAIRGICERGIVLERGRLVDDGDANRVADAYLTRLSRPTNLNCAIETESFAIEHVSIKSLNGTVIKPFDKVEISIDVRPKTNIGDPGLYVGILTAEATRVAGLDFRDFDTIDPIRKGEVASLGFVIESLPLVPGTYYLELHLKDLSTLQIEFVAERFPFEVTESPVYGGRCIEGWHGFVGLRANARDSRLSATSTGV